MTAGLEERRRRPSSCRSSTGGASRPATPATSRSSPGASSRSRCRRPSGAADGRVRLRAWACPAPRRRAGRRERAARARRPADRLGSGRAADRGQRRWRHCSTCPTPAPADRGAADAHPAAVWPLVRRDRTLDPGRAAALVSGPQRRSATAGRVRARLDRRAERPAATAGRGVGAGRSRPRGERAAASGTTGP